MANSFLDRLAIAHQRHEGWYPGSVAFRQNNPGNLRYRDYQRAYGAEKGDHGFAKFPSYALGFAALKNDIRAKIIGSSAHIDYTKHPTFLDYIKVYAPSDDGNNPNSYTQSLIRQLPEWNLAPNTPLTYMATLINGIPEPRTDYKSIAARLKSIKRGIDRALIRGLPKIANMLMRQEARLLKRI